MTVATGDILRVTATLVWTDGNINQNVFNAVVSGGGGPWADADIVADALAWVNNMFANFTTLLSDEIDGSQIQVYKWDSVGLDWDEVGSNAWTYNPNSVGEQLPRGVAALVTAQTTNPDVQGKKYLGGTTEGNVLDGLYNSTMLVAMLAFAADWITGFTGGTSGASWQPGVWSPTDQVLYNLVTSFTANAIAAYQRRRKRGIGA